MKRITIRRDAELDIDYAYKWYENNQIGLGEEFLIKLTESLKKIAEFSKMFPIVHRSLRRAFINKFPYGIFYMEQDESITVIAVMHVRKNPNNWQERI